MSQTETRKRWWHWRCNCGAHGNSNSQEANELVIARHRREGHVVEIWERGKQHLATTSGRYSDLAGLSDTRRRET